MSDWQDLEIFSDRASAEVVAGLLRSEGVPVTLAVDEPVPGLVFSIALRVPAALVHRARWVLAQAQGRADELDEGPEGWQ